VQWAFANDGQFTTIEMSHPLSGEAQDINVRPGDRLPLNLSLRLAGPRAYSDTVWPGPADDWAVPC
jgi:hypothetical protein